MLGVGHDMRDDIDAGLVRDHGHLYVHRWEMDLRDVNDGPHERGLQQVTVPADGWIEDTENFRRVPPGSPLTFELAR